MRSKRAARIFLGSILVTVGVAGLFLPFLQGILLLVAGIFVLSRDWAFARSLRAHLTRAFPRVSRSVESAIRRVQERLMRKHSGGRTAGAATLPGLSGWLVNISVGLIGRCMKH